MVTIVIDPVIIMLPPDDISREEVEKWFGNLTMWLKEALTAPFTWMHYKKASELLEAHGQFPSFEWLRQLQRKHRLDINTSLIARDVNTLFRDETLDLENYLKGLEFAIEPAANSITVEPEQFIIRLPAYLHDDLYILLADGCACKQIEHPFGQRLCIATLALANGTKEIIVSVIVQDALPDFTRPADNKIMQTFPLLITPDDLQPFADILDLWAKGEQGIIYAIEQQYRRAYPAAPLRAHMFKLGSDFIASVNERGLDTNEIILRSIIRAASDVIAGRAKDIPGYRLHPFRISETADSPQLIRDSDRARAWRLMLQKHGAGWRLQYWQIPTPVGYIIEFYNVCKESERKIE